MSAVKKFFDIFVDIFNLLLLLLYSLKEISQLFYRHSNQYILVKYIHYFSQHNFLYQHSYLRSQRIYFSKRFSCV